MIIRPLSSPNCDSRDGHTIDMLVMHYTGMRSASAAMDRLCEAAAQVSAHYVVDEEGGIWQLVDEQQRAWHAGVSCWRGHTNINQRSIGIEIVNPGHEYGYRPFPTEQMKSVIALSQGILARHEIAAPNVVGHSDVAPVRKADPGELFDWQWLAKEGIGVWPEYLAKKPEPFQSQKLADYGYDISELPMAITAFQRHFRPDKIDGVFDEQCGELLDSLLH